MTLFTQKITATILTYVLTCSLIVLSKTPIQAQRADGLYLNNVLLTSTPDTPYSQEITLQGNSTITQTGVANYSISSDISGAHNLTINIGARNRLNLQYSSYTGTTTVESGKLAIHNGNTSMITVQGGATLELYGRIYESHNFPLILEDGSTLHKSNTGWNVFDSHDVTVNGDVRMEITNSPSSEYDGSLNIGSSSTGLRGSGTLTIDNRRGNEHTGLTIRGTGPNHFKGTLVVQDGLLFIQGEEVALALDSASLNLKGSAVFLKHSNASLKSLDGEADTEVQLDAQTLTLGTDNGKSSYAGVINGSGGGLRKVGTDTVELLGANTYRGPCRVEKGVLKISGSLAMSVTIAGGKLMGIGTVSSVTLTHTAGSSLSGGSGPGNAGTLTINGTMAGRDGTLTGEDGTLEVYSSGSAVSTVQTKRASGSLIVDLKEPITAASTPDTFTLISCTHATSIMGAKMGTNNSGHDNVHLKWTAGVGLQVIVGGTVGLYQDDGLRPLATATTPTHSDDIELTQNSVFTEAKGTSHVTYELSGIISEDYGIKTQVDTLILSGDNTYTGTTMILAGTLQIGNGGNSGDLGEDAVTNNGTLIFNRTGDVDWTQAMSGRGTLAKRGSGTLTMSGTLTYTGPTTVDEGRLKIEHGTSPITVQSGATLELSGTADRDHKFPLILEANSTLVKSNSGKNTFDSHDVTVNGDVEIDITNSPAGSNNQQLYIGGSHTGLRGGSGTLTLDNGGNTLTGLILRGTGPDHFNGTLIVQDGRLGLGGSGGLALDSTLIRLEGTADFLISGVVGVPAVDASVKSLNGGNADTEVQLGDQTLTIGTDNGSGNYAGVISGSGGKVKKVGTGKQVLTGTNTYTGTTRVEGGILEIGSGGSLHESSAVTVEGGALGGEGAVRGNLTLKSTQGSAIYGGSGSDNADTLKIGGSFSAERGSVLKVYSSANRSRVSVVTVTEAATGHLIVNLEQAIADNSNSTPYTIISATTSTSFLSAEIGDNNSGHNHVRFVWTTGTGLQVTVGGTAGLYRDNDELTPADTPIHAGNIALVGNSVFTEAKGTSHVTYELRGIISGDTYGIETQVDSLILTGKNTYSGATLVSSGVLQIGKAGSGDGKLGSGAVTLSSVNSELLYMHGGNTHTVANAISGSGKLTQAGTDTLILIGANTYSGGTEIRSGSVQVGNGGDTGDVGTGEVSIVGAARLIYNRSDNVEWTNTVSGAGSLVKQGTGTLTLKATPTNYSGTVTVETDTLKIEDWTSAITVKNRAVLELFGSTGRDHYFPLTLEDQSIVVKSNTGYNTFNSHDITVNGEVKIEITNSPSGSNNDQQLYIGGRRTGLRGSGTLTIDNGGNERTGLTLRGTGPDHFKGTLIVQDGRLGLGDIRGNSVAGTALDSASISLQGTAKFLISGVATTSAVDASLKSLGGGGNTEVKLGSQILTLGTDNGKSSYAGVISGRGALKKVGTDTVELLGPNTYSGATRVEQGVLKVSGSLTSAVTVAGGKLMGTGTVPSVTLSGTAGSALSGGNGPGNADTLKISGMLTGLGTTLEVYSSGSAFSTVQADEASGDVTVDLKEEITVSNIPTTITLIACPHLSSSMIPSLGINHSGYNNATVQWIAGEGLQVVLRSTPGLYQDGTSLMMSSTPYHYSTDIRLDKNSVFKEVKGATHVTYELSGIISEGFGIDIQVVDTLILTGENTYGGVTKVSSGVLQIGKGATVGKLGGGAVILSSASSELLYKHGGNAHTVANAISGDGKLTQAGTDTLILTGENIYTGATQVQQGVLKVSGSLTSSVTIAGGKLLGTGTVPSVTLSGTAGSALSGGNGPGNADTLKISDRLTGQGGTLEVYSSGSSVSTVQANEVSGNVTVDLKEAITVSNIPTTITLISCTHNTSSMRPLLGVNKSGYNNARVQWTAGVGLQVILEANAPGLYQDGISLTTSSTPYSENIVLDKNSVFMEVKGPNHVTYELSGIISGSPFGIETRVDTLVLTGENTYRGTTKVSSGVLQIGKGEAVGKLGPGPVTLSSANSELLYKHGGNQHTVANAISGAGELTQAGTDTLILTGENTYGGVTKVSSGVLQIGKGAAVGKLGTGAVTLSSGSELLYQHGGNRHTVANAISGDGKLTQAGADTLILTGENSYTGSTQVQQGVLKVSGSLTSAVTVAGGKLMGTGTVPSVTLSNTAGSTLSGGNGPGNADTLKISDRLTGQGGTLEVYSSGLAFSIVRAGEASGDVTVDLKEPITVSNIPTTITLIVCANQGSSMNPSLGVNESGYNDATVQWIAGEGLQVILKTNTPGLYQDDTSLTASATPYSTDIGLTGNSLFKEVKGASSVTYELSGIISGDHGIETRVDTLILSGENTYTGTTTVTSGVLQIGKGAVGGKLGTGAVTLSSANSELLYKHGGNMHTEANAISGNGKLTQAGTDTLVLTGENTYSGATKVSSGVLQIGKDEAAGKLGTGAVMLSSASSELLYKHGGHTHTVANAISGLGKLKQAGTDTLILTGANTYIGPSRVEKGVLRVSGSLTSAVTVAGGALCGTGTVKSVVLGNAAGSALYGGNGTGHADTLKISGALISSGGALNVYSSGAGSSAKISLVKAGSVLGTVTVNIEGTLPTGTHTLISCKDVGSSLEPTLGSNSSTSSGCVTLSWQSGVGLKAEVGETSTVSATVAVDTTAAEQNATTKPKVTFTGSGGTAPYVFTYKIGDAGAEEFARGTGTLATAEVQVPTDVVGSFVYNLVRVSDSQGCTNSIADRKVTVAINAVTGDISKSGETVYVYPIPARDQIVIRSSKVLGRIQLRDLQGRVLIEREPSSSREVELSIADLPPGIYIVEVEEGQTLRRVKVSKE